MRRSFSRSGSGDRHRREVTFAIGSRGPTFRISNIWGPLAAVFFEVVVAIGWGFALSNLEGKFKGCGNTTSNVVRYRRNSCLVVADGREKGCKRTLLKKSIKVIGKLPAYCLVAVEDSKREGFMKDNAVPIAVKYFRDLLLNVFRQFLDNSKVGTMGVDLTSRGKGRDNWMIRPNDSPSARVIPGLASEFPLGEGCKKVRDMLCISSVEREMMGITIEDATIDSVIVLRWEGNSTIGNGYGGIGYLIPTFSIRWPGIRIIRVEIHGEGRAVTVW